jgi:hypothetical protein
MKLKITLVRSSNPKLPKKPAPEPVPTKSATNAQPIPAKFASYLPEPTLEALRHQKPIRIPAVNEHQQPAATGGLLRRVFSWLNGRGSTTKRLRVLETVALGDKRLVAVIQADGRRFLVGGGSSGVSLLTALDQAHRPLGEFESPGLTELAG